MKAFLLAAVLAAAGAPASALPAPPERLADPAQEARAHALFRQIRCLVCQNESIDDSDAPLAADLRALVRGDVAAGRPDAQIKRALVDRYGEFVLLRPSASAGNAVLWGLPFGLVAAGLAGVALRGGRARGAAAPRPLSEAERERVRMLAATATVPPPERPKDTTPAL